MKRLLFLSLFALLACKPTNNQWKDFLNWAQKGQITDKVICKNDQSLSYCLYLPSNYNLNRTWPILFCFDPKADGKLPVSLLKDVAEKYGYIVVGSYDSKNGLGINEFGLIASELIKDTKEKIAVDPNRMYAVGFSGGARVAYTMAMSYPSIKGIISCSAGFIPQQGQTLTFDVIGIAGNADMNFLEVKEMDESLVNFPIQHQLMVFDGTHHWPSKQMLAQAVTLLELFSMKENRIEKNDTLIKGYISENYRSINKLESYNNNDSLAKAFNTLECLIQSVEGLTNTDTLKNQLKQLVQKNNLIDYLKIESNIENNEIKQQEKYKQAYTTKPVKWWKDEIGQLQGKTKGKYSIPEVTSSKRLLAYISLMSYSYVNSAIAQHQWDAASEFLTIYGLADPENPDYNYFMACLLANTGEAGKAMISLKKAINLGFKDVNRLESDPLLQELRSKPEFSELLKKIK
jgi:hypothetical protein